MKDLNRNGVALRRGTANPSGMRRPVAREVLTALPHSLFGLDNP
jgi:hypothetical protein